MTENIYFELTAAFNENGRNVVLSSGQAVVYFRLAVMSKDGDWIVRETESACRRVRQVLARHQARYRPGAPLDPRWLSGGWSSHFEFSDPQGRRVRCDFFSRPPRVPPATLKELFSDTTAPQDLTVVDVASLIRMKQTQRAKDYPVIGELARLLTPAQELELTTDPDRILELAPRLAAASKRPAARAALAENPRLAVVQALAVEIDRLQQRDRRRMEAYSRASRAYLQAFHGLDREALALPESHERLCELADRLLPKQIAGAEE